MTASTDFWKPKRIERAIDSTNSELETDNFMISFKGINNSEPKITKVEVWNNSTQKWVDIRDFPSFIEDRLFQEAYEILTNTNNVEFITNKLGV